MESTAVSFHWKTSLNVGALVTLVAAVHYFYMREYYAHHCLCRLLHLPSGLLLRLPHGQCAGRLAQLDLQHCGCHQQDCLLPCHLALCQEGHHGEGRVPARMSLLLKFSAMGSTW